jgi:hypothetical protein
MITGNHNEGFEKEAKLISIHSQILAILEIHYKWKDFMKLAALINPELCEGAFVRRPCIRKLRYIGQGNMQGSGRFKSKPKCHDYFIYGNVYYSTDFNGATYSIEGRPKPTGYVYFEWLMDNQIHCKSEVLI